MRIFIRALSFIAFLGTGYWIYASRQEVEPYVTCIASLAAFCGTFVGVPKASVVPSLITKNRQHYVCLENLGDADASDIQVIFHDSQPFHQRDLDLFPKSLVAKQDFEMLIALDLSKQPVFDVSCSWKGEWNVSRTTRRQKVILR